MQFMHIDKGVEPLEKGRPKEAWTKTTPFSSLAEIDAAAGFKGFTLSNVLTKLHAGVFQMRYLAEWDQLLFN